MNGINSRTAEVAQAAASRRSFLRAGLAGGLLAVGGTGLLAACGSSSPSTAGSSAGGSATSSGASVSATLTSMRSSGAVLGLADAPPYSSLNSSGEVTGFGPAVATAVLKSLGVTTFKGVVGTYATMVPGMQAGRWQMIAAVLEITKARCGQIMYADPIEFDGACWGYLPSYQNPPTSLKGAPTNIKIGVLTGAYLIPLALAAGYSNGDILQFPDRPSLVTGLKQGRIELALNTTTAMTQLAKQENNSFKVTGNLTDVPVVGSSVALSKSDPAFYAEFQSGLAKLRSSGELAKIRAQWGFLPETAAQEATTAEQACATATS
jgi:polar amino acid transport system substrate-binding protein